MWNYFVCISVKLDPLESQNRTFRSLNFPDSFKLFCTKLTLICMRGGGGGGTNLPQCSFSAAVQKQLTLDC